MRPAASSRPPGGRLRRLGVLASLALAIAVLASPPPAGAAQPRASLADIQDEVMCPICGTTLEMSGSPQAERERDLIRRLIAQGRTKGQIEDALVAQYGPDVLAVPADHGFDLTAWLVPGLALLAAAALVGGTLLARSRRPGPGPPLAPLDPADTERLAEDMSRYDL
jgi:cytochrome c-type biogenesis protein CcmH/NrfF